MWWVQTFSVRRSWLIKYHMITRYYKKHTRHTPVNAYKQVLGIYSTLWDYRILRITYFHRFHHNHDFFHSAWRYTHLEKKSGWWRPWNLLQNRNFASCPFHGQMAFIWTFFLVIFVQMPSCIERLVSIKNSAKYHILKGFLHINPP